MVHYADEKELNKVSVDFAFVYNTFTITQKSEPK